MNPKDVYTGAGIYQFTCNITGKIYVGKSKDCKVRYYRHVVPSSKIASKSIIAGGDYTYDILERLPINVSDELLSDREQHWMEQVPSENLLNIYKAKYPGHKAYRDAHMVELAAHYAANKAANKEKTLAYAAAYHYANKEKRLAQMAEHYAANKDKIAAQQAAYYAANKEKILAQQATYRAKKLLKTEGS